MKVAVNGYYAGKAWLCMCVGVEPPFSKSWIRHCFVIIIMTGQLHKERKL